MSNAKLYCQAQSDFMSQSQMVCQKCSSSVYVLALVTLEGHGAA